MADNPTLTDATNRQLALRERPEQRVVMRQRWERLLFLHWRIAPEVLQSRLPRGLTVDVFDDSAWLGVVPFFMRNIRIRGLPPMPTATNFLELNLRTYVRDALGTPGVWFFSLDADSWLAVHGARRWFGLPYHYARMSADVDAATGEVDYHWRRRGAPSSTGSQFRYRPISSLRIAEPGTLEFFLVERYLLYAAGRNGKLFTGRVWHEPYAFADAAVAQWDENLITRNGFPGGLRPPDHAVVSPGVQVDVFGLQPASA